jgi:hypothetical protein
MKPSYHFLYGVLFSAADAGRTRAVAADFLLDIRTTCRYSDRAALSAKMHSAGTAPLRSARHSPECARSAESPRVGKSATK